MSGQTLPGEGTPGSGRLHRRAGSVELQIGGRGLAAFHRDVKTNFLSVIQSLQAGSLNSSDMHEHVFAAVLRHDEPIPLGRVKPLHGSLGHGVVSPLIVRYESLRFVAAVLPRSVVTSYDSA